MIEDNRNELTFTHVRRNFQGDIETQIKYSIFNEGGIDEVMQEFRRFLLAVSFHPNSISEYIKEE